MVIDFTGLIYMLFALYIIGGMLIGGLLGFGVWTMQKYLNRECEAIQRRAAMQRKVSPQFVDPLAKAQV